MKFPAFGETTFFETRENASAITYILPQSERHAFDAYCALLLKNGYEQKESYCNNGHCFAAFSRADEGVFLNYYEAIRELTLVTEEHCRYFSYRDQAPAACVCAQITQIALEVFGLSYAIRLPDGRFVVIDGGCEFETDADRLFRCLCDGSPEPRPVIAMWVMTHPHDDHFHCFFKFMEKYVEAVEIEKFLLNFPDANDLAHYPKLADGSRLWLNSSGAERIPRMFDVIKQETNAPVYMAHTGQRYRVGDAVCEILASIDDTIHCSDNINATSLVMRMELAGQVILWTADASFAAARLPQKYGSYLKADILQVPHHGFQSGDPNAEIAGYALIAPQVCLLPASEDTAYTLFSAHRPSTRYLMRDVGVAEMIAGTPQRTITLPYTPPAYGKKELERNYHTGLDNCGATTWIFSNLSTACAEDFEFTLLNTTLSRATVWIELFFENTAQRVRFIKAELGKCCIKQLSIIGDEVDGDALYFNSLSLKAQGIPENAPFAVRFLCDVPIVVSHRRHAASYHTAGNR